MKAEYTPLSSEVAPFIRVNPTLVLFTQGEISSIRGEGSHQGKPIDETILELQADPNLVNQLAELHAATVHGSGRASDRKFSPEAKAWRRAARQLEAAERQRLRDR